MLRTATRPRLLGLLAVALLLATLFAWLGDWQLGRARAEAARTALAEAGEQPVADLHDVLRPAQPVTADDVRRLVRASGRLETDRVLRVPDRKLDGAAGFWLLAPLRVDGGGGTLPVALGWLPAGAAVPELDGGQVELTGRLEQSEAPVGVDTSAPAPTQVPVVSSADLVNLWDPPLYTAYLAVTDPAPPLRPVPESEPPSGFALQNLSYALQWWLFAGFAVFFWWRLVRDAHERELERREAESSA